MEHKITLGQALAYLYYSKVNRNTLVDLDNDERAYLSNLADHAENLNLSYKNNSKDFSIKTKSEHKIKYTDLFINMFLNNNIEKNNLKLMKFFNNNIDCFEEYSKVFNDFTQKLDELKESIQEKL